MTLLLFAFIFVVYSQFVSVLRSSYCWFNHGIYQCSHTARFNIRSPIEIGQTWHPQLPGDLSRVHLAPPPRSTGIFSGPPCDPVKVKVVEDERLTPIILIYQAINCGRTSNVIYWSGEDSSLVHWLNLAYFSALIINCFITLKTWSSMCSRSPCTLLKVLLVKLRV